MFHRNSFRAVAAAVFLSGLALSAVGADPRMPGDPLVESIRAAYARVGRVQPFTSFPVTEDELRRAVEELARDPAVDGASLVALERMLPPVRDRVDVDLDLSYVRYFRTSEEYIEQNCDYENGIDLYRLYLSEPVPLSLSLGWAGENGLFLYATDALRRELDASDYFKSDNFWQLGDSDNPVAIENHDFVRGVLGWTGNGFRLTFGRDRMHFGPETFSSLLVSDRIPYMDSARASVPFGPFRMDWYVASIPAFKVDPSIPPDGTVYNYYKTANASIILDALHRFEWRGKTVRAAVSGNVTYVRPNNYFELSDFFPVLSWHSNDVMPNNLRLIADVSWCFLPGWTISAQAGYDDISANIVGVGDNGVPTIDAYILAVRWDGGSPERRIRAHLEGGYTHFLWGSYDEVMTSHDGETGVSSGTLARAIYRLRVDWGAQALPLTSPYGPGALWLRGAFELPDLAPDLSLEIGALLLSKNRKADLLNTIYTYDEDIENASRTTYGELSATARYAWRSFAFTFAPLLAARDGEFWAELALGAVYSLDLRIPVKKE